VIAQVTNEYQATNDSGLYLHDCNQFGSLKLRDSSQAYADNLSPAYVDNLSPAYTRPFAGENATPSADLGRGHCQNDLPGNETNPIQASDDHYRTNPIPR